MSYYDKDDHIQDAPPYMISENAITILWNGTSHIVSSSSPNFHALEQCIKNDNWDDLPNCLDVKEHYETISEGNVSVQGNKVLYKGEHVHNAAATKLVNLMQAGFSNIQPWCRFIDKLMGNPSFNSRDQLYNFLEQQHMPITETGNVIGYKGVDNDYKDIYSSTFDNSVGQTLEMPRTGVDDNAGHGCSSGFHIGSHQYADSWGSNGRLMVVEFNPSDAVSVPNDGYEKLRVCKYTVVGESHSRQPVNEGLFTTDTNSNDREDDLMNYLYKRWNKHKSPRFSKMLKKFPDLTYGELQQAISESGETATIDWSGHDNEYRVRLH